MKNYLFKLLILLSISFSIFADKRPNIIFFISDDMLPVHFNCLSNEKPKYLTPNIDRLAEEGLVLLQQHVVSPVCTPSRYSVLTGNYPSRTNNKGFKNRTLKEGQSVVQFNTDIISTDITLGHRLQAGGYVTGFVGKNHVVQSHGMKKFNNYDADPKNPEIQSKLQYNHDQVCMAIRDAGFNYADRIYHNNPPYIGIKEVGVHNLDWITEGGVNFIKKNADKPFFLYFAATVPHGPTEQKRSWNADPHITAIGYLEKPPNVMPKRNTIPERLKKAKLPTSDNRCNILWLDDSLGALLDQLEEENILDNTLIFFFNDHGQTAKGTLYQGGVRNPSIVWKSKGFSLKEDSELLISSIDFAPTILDIAGVKYNSLDFDGTSFLPHLLGKKIKEKPVYFELGYARGIRKGDWKYIAIRYPDSIENMSFEERKIILDSYNSDRRKRYQSIVTEDPSSPFSHFNAIPGGGDAERVSTGKNPNYYDKDQLYLLSVDPEEQENLANNPTYQKKLEDMQQALINILKTLPGNFPL